MPDLIPVPVLDDRDEEQRAAEAIARISGGLTVEQIDKAIETWRTLRAMAEAGTLPVAAFPELTNANPSAPHTVIVEHMAWLVGLQSYKINLFPERDELEFFRLFGIELRAATGATAALEFSVHAPAGVDVTVPAGTGVKVTGTDIVFETTAELIIPAGAATGITAARRTMAGATVLLPDTLTEMVDQIAFVSAVTNPEVVDSGSDAETIDSARRRARSYLRRGERLVTAQDLEDAILDDVLFGNGIVRAFPLVKDGDYEAVSAGHTTVVVMTKAGNPVDAEVKERISLLLAEAIGNPFIYVKDPAYVAFDAVFKVRLKGLVTQSATLSAIERNLRAFYAPSEGNLGRSILRSEIIAVIEGTEGVDRIEPQPGGAILASPAADVDIAPYELPKLINVTPTVVV